MQFIDNIRFMSSPLPNPVDNFAEGIDNINCKYRRSNEK